MTFISAIIGLLGSIPEILKLIAALQAAQKEQVVQKKVSDDVATIHEAFVTKDASKLNALFQST